MRRSSIWGAKPASQDNGRTEFPMSWLWGRGRDLLFRVEVEAFSSEKIFLPSLYLGVGWWKAGDITCVMFSIHMIEERDIKMWNIVGFFFLFFFWVCVCGWCIDMRLSGCTMFCSALIISKAEHVRNLVHKLLQMLLWCSVFCTRNQWSEWAHNHK